MRERLATLIDEMIDGHLTLEEVTAEFEKIYIEKAIERTRGNKQRAAAMLGISRSRLYRLLLTYKISIKKKVNHTSAIFRV